jgi:hypothetical protein
MIFGLCFASMWLGCGIGEDEAWSDDDGVVPAEGVVDREWDPALEHIEPAEADLDIPSESAGQSE